MNFEIFKEQPETVAELPTETRAKLDAVKAQLQQETEPIAQTALQNFDSATNREELLGHINELQRTAEFPKLTEGMRNSLSALQREMETSFETVTRVGVGTAASAKDNLFDPLPPIVKGAAGVGGIIAGSALVMKAWEFVKNLFVGAGKKISGASKAIMGKGNSFLTWTKRLALGTLVTMGVLKGKDMLFPAQEADSAETNKA